MERFALFVTVTLGMAGFVLIWAFVWSIVVAWAWNMSVRHISSGRVPTIDYWQAYGVIVLTGLVKGSCTAASSK